MFRSHLVTFHSTEKHVWLQHHDLKMKIAHIVILKETLHSCIASRNFVVAYARVTTGTLGTLSRDHVGSRRGLEKVFTRDLNGVPFLGPCVSILGVPERMIPCMRCYSLVYFL